MQKCQIYLCCKFPEGDKNSKTHSQAESIKTKKVRVCSEQAGWRPELEEKKKKTLIEAHRDHKTDMF